MNVIDRLAPPEPRIAEFAALGMTNREIATILAIHEQIEKNAPRVAMK